jgi:hypothetical protein
MAAEHRPRGPGLVATVMLLGCFALAILSARAWFGLRDWWRERMRRWSK